MIESFHQLNNARSLELLFQADERFRHAAAQCPYTQASGERSPGVVAAPEGHAGHGPRSLGHDEPVIAELGHAPHLIAEQEGVAEARLEDEFFVELSDLGFAVG